MDTPTLVAILGFFGTVVTATGGAIVAVLVNRSEKKQSAESSIEKTLRERITFKEEQLADLRQDLAEEKLKRADAEARADRNQATIDAIRAEEQAHNDQRQ